MVNQHPYVVNQHPYVVNQRVVGRRVYESPNTKIPDVLEERKLKIKRKDVVRMTQGESLQTEVNGRVPPARQYVSSC